MFAMSCSPAKGPLARHAKGVSLSVQLRPGGRGSDLEGLVRLGDGCRALKATVTEQADKGRANRALASSNIPSGAGTGARWGKAKCIIHTARVEGRP